MKRAKVKKNTMIENNILLHIKFVKKAIKCQCCLSHIYGIRRGEEGGGRKRGKRGKLLRIGFDQKVGFASVGSQSESTSNSTENVKMCSES